MVNTTEDDMSESLLLKVLYHMALSLMLLRTLVPLIVTQMRGGVKP